MDTIEKKKWNKPEIKVLKGYMTETGSLITQPTEATKYEFSP